MRLNFNQSIKINKRFKRVIAIRTNKWGNEEKKLYHQLLTYFQAEEIFFVVESIKSKPQFPENYQVIYWGAYFLERNKLIDYLFAGKNSGWLCGDYFYYALKEQIESEFYWLIEPDVLLNFEHISSFFKPLEERPDEALLAFYTQAKSSWQWYKSGTLIDTTEKYISRCLFPISRLSAEAIELCFIERQRITEIYIQNQQFKYSSDKEEILFPNDEVLVATTLTKQGKSISSFDEIFKNMLIDFDHFFWKTYPRQKNNRIIHPIRTNKELSDNVSSELVRIIKNSDSLHKIKPEVEDITEVTENILHNIRNCITQELKIGTLIFKLRSYLEENISYHFPNLLICFNVWIWKKKTVVVDFKLEQKTFSLDISFNQHNINCIAFVRNNQDLSLELNPHYLFLPIEIKKSNRKAYQIFDISTDDEKLVYRYSWEAVEFYFSHFR